MLQEVVLTAIQLVHVIVLCCSAPAKCTESRVELERCGCLVLPASALVSNSIGKVQFQLASVDFFNHIRGNSFAIYRYRKQNLHYSFGSDGFIVRAICAVAELTWNQGPHSKICFGNSQERYRSANVSYLNNYSWWTSFIYLGGIYFYNDEWPFQSNQRLVSNFSRFHGGVSRSLGVSERPLHDPQLKNSHDCEYSRKQSGKDVGDGNIPIQTKVTSFSLVIFQLNCIVGVLICSCCLFFRGRTGDWIWATGAGITLYGPIGLFSGYDLGWLIRWINSW